MDTGLAYFIVATLVTLVVEWIRGWATAIDGRLVNLLAWAVGFAATYVPDELVPAFAFDGLAFEERLFAGAILAGVASVVAESKRALNNSGKINAEALRQVGEGDEAYAPEPSSEATSSTQVGAKYDEGFNGEPGYDPATGHKLPGA